MLDDLNSKINRYGLDNNIITINADMISYVHNKKVNCVIMPLTVFNYILTEEEQYKCLDNIGTYLNIGGILVAELLTKKIFSDLNENSDNTLKYVKKLNTTDGYYEYWHSTSLDIKTYFIEQRRVFKHFNKED